MKIWCTKWALTRGILELEGNICVDVSPDMVATTMGAFECYLHGEGKDWHRDEESAVKWALVMIEKKEKALARQVFAIRTQQDVLKLRLDWLRAKKVK